MQEAQTTPTLHQPPDELTATRRESFALRAELSAPSITFGAGDDRPQGQTIALRNDIAASRALLEALAKRPPHVEGWFAIHTFRGAYRLTDNWISAAFVGVDLDYYEGALHVAMPAEMRAKAIALALGHRLPGSCFYDTPRGLRIMFALAEPVTSPKAFEDVAAAAGEQCEEVITTLGLAGLQLDKPALFDRARFLYTPNAIVKGERRSGRLILMREEPYTADELTPSPGAPRPESLPPTIPAPVIPPAISRLPDELLTEGPVEVYERAIRPRLTAEILYGHIPFKSKRGSDWRGPCPLHGGAKPNFSVNPQTLGWFCHSDCGKGGGPIEFVNGGAKADGAKFTEAVKRLGALLGIEMPTRFPRRRGPAPAARAPREKPERTYMRPPEDEVRALWESAVLVADDVAASAYLAGRKISPGDVEDRNLARVIPPDVTLPAWAMHDRRPWNASDHRLLIPLYGATGRLESLRARLVRAPQGDELKALAPVGANVGGLVMADVLGRRMLAGDADAVELARAVGVWIAEGEPDFLTLATGWSDADENAPAILGMVSGSLTSQIAARIPNGTRVALCFDPDAAGEKYVAAAKVAFGERWQRRAITLERGRWNGRGQK